MAKHQQSLTLPSDFLTQVCRQFLNIFNNQYIAAIFLFVWHYSRVMGSSDDEFLHASGLMSETKGVIETDEIGFRAG